jgi:hypothetical protein
MWVHFVRHSESTLPGDIINDSIYSIVDSGKKIYLGRDALLISKKLWDTFYDWYRGGPTLKWKIELTEPPASVSSRPT